MDIVTFLVIGLLSGWAASVIIEGHGIGVLGDIIVGIIGAFVGGYLFSMLGVSAYGFWGSVGMSIVGAVVFLFIVGLLSPSTGHPTKL